MKEKILIYDSSLGYGLYFERILKKDYEIKSVSKNYALKKIDLFYYDNLIFIINQPDDVQLFLKIYTVNKGLHMFVGITQEKYGLLLKGLPDIEFINLELVKTDIIKYIQKKLNQYNTEKTT